MFNIAFNTFRELVRNRILTLIAFFSSVMIAFSLVLASLSLGQTERIVLDFGLAMIEICGLISVIFVGGQILFRELEGRTIYLILSKPIARHEFILGKFLGFGMILVLMHVLESLVFLWLLFYTGNSFDPLVFVALASILLKLLLVFAIILFFSTFASPMLSILVTIGIYVASHGISGMLDMGLRIKNDILVYVSKGLLTILPNFEAMNFAKNTIGTPVALHGWLYVKDFATALLYLGIILVLTVVIFNRKGFENA